MCVISLSVNNLLNELESTYTGACFICSGLAISLILKASLIDAERDLLCYNLQQLKCTYIYTQYQTSTHAIKRVVRRV